MKKRKINLTKLLLLTVLFSGISIILYNCDKEELITPQIHSENEIHLSHELNYKIENLSYNQASSENLFSNLKSKFNIQEPDLNIKNGTYYAKFNIDNTKSKKSTDFSNIDASLDMSSIKKITLENYISYTIRFMEPMDTSDSFSNIVIQENNGIQEIFTVRYTPIQNSAKTTISSSKFEGSYTMRKGVIPYDGWEGLDGDNTGGGSNDFIEVCDQITLIVPIPCKCPAKHMPWQFCTCYAGKPDFGEETKEECYTQYIGDYNDTTGNNFGGGTENSNIEESTVITTPVTAILAEGALETILECVKPNQSQINWINSALNEKNRLGEVTSIWHLINQNSCNKDTESSSQKYIDILNNTFTTNILNTPQENQNFVNLVSTSLYNKNKVIFAEFNTIFNNLDDNNNLTIFEWQTISQKIKEIYDITKNYDLIPITDISQLSYDDQRTIAQNSLFISFLPNLKDLGISLPNSSEEWKVFFEIMKPILLEIGIEFIPLGGVYNSAVDTLNGINSGDWTAITFGVVGIIVEFTPFDQIKNLFQLIRYSKKGIKIFKLTRKFTNVIKNALDTGIKISLEGLTVIFKKDGKEVARILNDVMTLKYTGFGGDIVSNPNKTTTVIGKWKDGTQKIIDSGFSKSGKNTGGINALNTVTKGMNSQDVWNTINKPWLQKAVNRGDIIRAVSDPNLSSNLVNPNTFNGLSFFGMEHNFLTKPISQGGAGYTYDAVNKLYKP